MEQHRDERARCEAQQQHAHESQQQPRLSHCKLSIKETSEYGQKRPVYGSGARAKVLTRSIPASDAMSEGPNQPGPAAAPKGSGCRAIFLPTYIPRRAQHETQLSHYEGEARSIAVSSDSGQLLSPTSYLSNQFFQCRPRTCLIRSTST